MNENREYNIFISYRRLDKNGNISGRDQARLIAKQLEIKGFKPFFDYSEIRDDEFDKAIIPAVENCKIFILVLSKDALDRCENENDWVRKEVETAIKFGRKIINVTPDKAFNGWPDKLPKSLSKITRIQISDIDCGSLFEVSMEKLIEERIIPGLNEKHILEPPKKDNPTGGEIIDLGGVFEENLDSDEWYRRGYDAYYGKGKGHDTYEAVKCFKRASELGNVEAQKFLSKCYYLRIGVEEDKEKALYWISKAAEKKDAFAMMEMANSFYSRKDYKEAYEYYKEVADYNYDSVANDHLTNRENPFQFLKDDSLYKYVVDAICKIGEMFEKGYYHQVDYQKAKEWYKRAKELGKPEPLKKLLEKIKTDTNATIAIDMPELLSEEEKYDLARRLIHGNSSESNYLNAVPLLEECSAKGNYEAMKDLAFCYSKGLGCKKNEEEAYSLYEKVFNSTNDADVRFKLAVMTELGNGTIRDFGKSVSMYIESAKNGNELSIKHLANLFKYKRLTRNNDELGYQICNAYLYALNFGNPFSQNREIRFFRESIELETLSCLKECGLDGLMETGRSLDSLYTFADKDREKWEKFKALLKRKRKHGSLTLWGPKK